jgi:hypothetical protein
MLNKQTKALRLALDAICGSGDFLFNWHECEPNNEREMQRYQETLEANEKAFNAIREVLAEQPAIKQDLTPEQPAQQQEPLFKPLIDSLPGLAEELKAMDVAQPQQESSK